MNGTNKDRDDGLVWEQLSKIGQLAHNGASLEILEVVAAAAGISNINGVSIRLFFERRKREIVENLVADFADTNPTLASQIKAAWEKLDHEQR